MDIRVRKSGFVVAVGWVGVGGKRCSGPMEETKATMVMRWMSWRIFSAMAPAATRPGWLVVSWCAWDGMGRMLRTYCFPCAASASAAAGFDAVFF